MALGERRLPALQWFGGRGPPIYLGEWSLCGKRAIRSQGEQQRCLRQPCAQRSTARGPSQITSAASGPLPRGAAEEPAGAGRPDRRRILLAAMPPQRSTPYWRVSTASLRPWGGRNAGSSPCGSSAAAFRTRSGSWAGRITAAWCRRPGPWAGSACPADGDHLRYRHPGQRGALYHSGSRPGGNDLHFSER